MEETVITLLEKGAKINHQGGNFGTALHAAVFGNSLRMMQLLLQHRVDVETPNQYGFTVSYWLQNDTILTDDRHREVRNLFHGVRKGSAAGLIDVLIRRKTIVSLSEQLKQETRWRLGILLSWKSIHCLMMAVARRRHTAFENNAQSNSGNKSSTLKYL